MRNSGNQVKGVIEEHYIKNNAFLLENDHFFFDFLFVKRLDYYIFLFIKEEAKPLIFYCVLFQPHCCFFKQISQLQELS